MKRQPHHLRRLPKVEWVPMEMIQHNKNQESDEVFLQLYVNWLQGKIIGTWTRVGIETIRPGFFKLSESGQLMQIGHQPDSSGTDAIARMIKTGRRPTLVLYRGHVDGTEKNFICADDVNAYFAYRQLKITQVPSMVLGEKGALELQESAFSGRVVSQSSITDVRLIVKENSHFVSILGSDAQLASINPIHAVATLAEAVEKVEKSIRQFHSNSATHTEIHYHHTLHSVAYRMKESLLSIKLLIQNNYSYQIRPIVRSFYELFLNFYIDWLAPERIGPHLQLLAAARRLEDTKKNRELRKNMRKKFALTHLCETVSEKGRISPLGESFHNQLYRPLSSVVHQDFGVTGEYSDTLEKGVASNMDERELLLLVRWLDMITSAAIVRLSDDVGTQNVQNY